MNHSIYSADRSTHLKIVIVALCAGAVVAGIGLLSGDAGGDGNIHAHTIKAGKSFLLSDSANVTVR
jgi:hypothetical protein